MSRVKKSMKVAALCCALVGGFEGYSAVAYRDPVGIVTACYGETKGIRMGMRFTKAQCDQKLAESLEAHARGMEACTNVELPDERYVGLLSFTYNVGVASYCGSTLVRKLNDGDTVGACDELLKWNKAKGIPLRGLTRRREAERELCLKGT